MVKNKSKLFKILSYVVLAGVMFISFYYIKTHIYQTLNSDDASELILGKLLANENTLISKSWYYSTELRVLNTNIFYALLFKFTDNFFVVRMISYLLMWIVLLLIYFGLCKALNIKRYKIISACLLFVPFSSDYYSFVLSTAYYIPHIAITFLTIMLLELYLSKKKPVYLILGGALALIAGLGGPRQILVTYLPLFLAPLLTYLFSKDKDYSFFKYSLIVLIFSGIGYVINSKILHNYYSFESYNNIRYVTFNLSRLTDLLNGLIFTYGYRSGDVMSATTIVNGIAAVNILISVYAIYYSLKNKNKISGAYYRFSLFVLFAYLSFILLYVFTDMSYENRYYLPLTVLYIPLTVLFFNEAKINIFNIKTDYLYLLFILMIFVQGVSCMYSYNTLDRNAEKREILKVLEDNGYKNGYATFWNGNIYTELSNGDIECWVFFNAYAMEKATNFNELYEWLQVKDHMSNKPSGKVFVLLTSEEYETTPLKKYLDDDYVLYVSGNYVVFGYESYEELIK